MIVQQTLFETARTERDDILARLAAKHTTYLEFVRAIARELAVRHWSVTIDDVREELAARKLPMPADIGADERVFGALFRSKEFEAIGTRATTRMEFAARVGAQRSRVTVYRIRKEAA